MRAWPFRGVKLGAQQDPIKNIESMLKDLNTQLGMLAKATSDRTATFPQNVAGTPDVNGASVWRTNNTVATNITGFLNGYDTARIVVIAGDGNTTLVHSATFRMAGGINVTLATNQVREFVGSADPTTRIINWYEIP
jgi:hypothetical protein